MTSDAEEAAAVRLIYITQAERSVEVIAHNLERLASRLRTLAGGYQHLTVTTNPHVLRSGAVGVAAEIINEYTNGVGNNGTHLWDVIRNAQALDDHRREVSDD